MECRSRHVANPLILELRPRPINQFVIAETAAYNLGGELCKVHLLERGYKAYDFERGLSD